MKKKFVAAWCILLVFNMAIAGADSPWSGGDSSMTIGNLGLPAFIVVPAMVAAIWYMSKFPIFAASIGFTSLLAVLGGYAQSDWLMFAAGAIGLYRAYSALFSSNKPSGHTIPKGE